MRKPVFALAACALAATFTAAQQQPRQRTIKVPIQHPEVPAKPAEVPVKHAEAPPAPAAPAPPAVRRPPPAPAVKIEPLKVVPEELFARELKDIDGQSFQLSGFRERVFVVNLWATWCGPCRKEIPELTKLYEEFSPRGVEFVGLTTEDPETDAEKVREFAAQFGVRYKLGWADRETALALMAGRNAIPQTLVVGPDGRVFAHFRGYSPRLPALIKDAIEKALEPAPPADAAAPAETLAPPRP